VWLSTALPCFLSSPYPKPISCEMPESLSEVKARLLREQRERTDERIRELRCERRQNIKRETLGEVRVRAREEQRVRTEERVQHWQKVEDWLDRDSRRVWVVRLSCNILCYLSCGPVDVQRYRYLLCPPHDHFPRLGLRTYFSEWVREEDRVEGEEGNTIEEGPH